MSKKVTLEVRSGSNYGKATAFMRKNQIYTKTMLVEFFQTLTNKDGELLGMGASLASTGVMLSPRLTSSGDCRGNPANSWGHLAYNEVIARKIDKETGKKSEQKFRFRHRAEAMDKRYRKDQIKAKSTQEKTAVIKKVKVKSKEAVTA
jgi:hypothetical protein